MLSHLGSSETRLASARGAYLTMKRREFGVVVRRLLMRRLVIWVRREAVLVGSPAGCDSSASRSGAVSELKGVTSSRLAAQLMVP